MAFVTPLAWVVLVAGAFEVAPARGAEAALLEDAKDGALDRTELLRAALVASGVPDRELDAAAQRTRRALAPAIARARRQRTPVEQGRALLSALHDTVLVRYQMHATDIDDVVSTGEFNCLSSALLYVIAAQELGIETRAMVTKRHAFARVVVGGAPLDVETTSPHGFGIDRSKALSDELLERIAPRGSDRSALREDLKNPDELPNLTLVAGVYANRSVGLVARGELSAAATALDRATRLASGAARARFASWRASVVNDGARVLIDEGRLDDAQALLELALEGATGDTRTVLRTNLGRVHLRKADARAAQQDWRAVLEEIGRAETYGVGGEVGNLRAVAQGKLAGRGDKLAKCTGKPPEVATCLAVASRALLEAGDVAGAIDHARNAVALSPQQKDARSALFFALQQRAHERTTASACDEVEGLVRELERLKDVLDDKRWSAASFAASCFAQRAAAAYDAQRWDEAARLLRRALVHTPGEPSLRQNLARVDLNRAIGLARDARCDDARPLVRRAVKADAALSADGERVLEACSNARVVAASKRKAWTEGAAEARRGLLENPDSALLKKNLVVMLTNACIEALSARRCDEARVLLEELDDVGAPASTRDELRTNQRARCPS